MDESPSQLENEELEALPLRVRRAAEDIEWVEFAAVRLREHGHAVTGEVFVVPRDRVCDVRLAKDVGDRLANVDWRLHDLVVVLTPDIEDVEPPRLSA